MIEGKIIFISPLDWGMGHSTRCVPLIKDLSQRNKIIIGVSHLNEVFFDKHFPELKKVKLPSYNIHYSKFLPVWLKILFQFSKIKKIIEEENKLLSTLITENKIDLVISDNRFGLYNKTIETIFITHQLKILTPFFSDLANKKNREYIHLFNRVWIPDYKNPSDRLAGALDDAKHIKIPVEYIGPQSALTNCEIIKISEKKYDYLILLSGVEPQRSILEKKLVSKFKDTKKKIVLVRGSANDLEIDNENINVLNFAFNKELKELILSSETIICRSGYSTLMDLHILNKKQIILIPTPGQTEQVYLAILWKEKFGAKLILQKNLTRTKIH